MGQQQINFSVMADWAMAGMELVTSTMSMDNIIAEATEDDVDDEDDLNVADALPTLPATDCPASSSPTADNPTGQEAVRCMEKALRYLENCPDADEMKVIQMKSLLSLTKGWHWPKQARITDYFSSCNNSDWFPCDAAMETLL